MRHGVRQAASRWCATAVLVVLVAGSADAADGVVMAPVAPSTSTSAGAWTEERMEKARPVPLPGASTMAPAARSLGDAPTGPVIEGKSYQPATEPVPDTKPMKQKHGSTTSGSIVPTAATVAPRSVGTSKRPFTSREVFYDTYTDWPYRLAGKLFFTDPVSGLDYICSASINSYRLIATAGHCVYDGKGKYFYTNFAFVPSYGSWYGTTAPYGTWTAAYAITTTSWANGKGKVPNRGDFAFLVAQNQGVNRIGAYLGYLGYSINSLVGRHVTQLGYPANLDSGYWMIENAAQAVGRKSGTKVIAAELGSAMGGGSSGGPWIQDFGYGATGQYISSTGSNALIGVTSYGPAEGNYPRQYQGSSILNAEWLTMRNAACGIAADVC